MENQQWGQLSNLDQVTQRSSVLLNEGSPQAHVLLVSPCAPSEAGAKEDGHLTPSEPSAPCKRRALPSRKSPVRWVSPSLSPRSEMFFGELIQRRTTRWRQTPPVSRRRAPGNLRKQMNLEFPLRIRCLHSWGSPGPQAPLPVIVHRQCNPTKIDRLDLGSSRVLRP